MPDLSFRSKLVLVIPLAALLFTLGECVMRRARTTIRTRRTDEVEQLLSE